MTTVATIDAPKLRADELWVDTAVARAIDADARRKDTEVQKKLILAGLTGGPYARITGRDRDGRRYRPMQKGTIERFAVVWGVELPALLAGGTGLTLPAGGVTPTDIITDHTEKKKDESRGQSWLRRLNAKAHRRVVVALVLLTSVAGLVIFADWLAYEYPARTISTFFEALNRNADTPSHHDTRTAWQLLSPDLQKVKGGDWVKFDSYYETTVSQDDVNIEVTGNLWNPTRLISTLTAKVVYYEVTYEAKDYFTKFDCPEKSKDINRENCNAFIPQPLLAKLREGTINDPNHDNPAITVIRLYKKRFRLERSSMWSRDWLITGITWIKWGVQGEPQEGRH